MKTPTPVAVAEAAEAPEAVHPEAHRSAAERSVRVDVDLLDAMMSQVGELVLARNQVSAHVTQIENQALHQTMQRLSMIVSELQEGIMKTRMQARFPRASERGSGMSGRNRRSSRG